VQKGPRRAVAGARAVLQPEEDLDLAHLEALEPARRRKLVAIQEVLRGERLHDANWSTASFKISFTRFRW
jgi:hypothetical protein